MIYLKNNTEIQAIYIPRQTVLGGGYIPSTKAYEKGYRDGLEDGKEQQKDKLSSLHVAENGQYEREDGWDVVTVDVPDLNGSYNEGYEQGKTDGIDEQKGKLESINITENGVYSKEDGYNHIEVNVPSYEQGQADMAAKARVLEVTKNGNYLSKFSDPIIPTTVTGVYADDTKFYSYALISNIIYSTGIIPNQNTRLEFWFKPYGTEYEDWEIIIGSQRGDDTSDTFQVRRYATSTNFVAEIGTSEVSFTMSENEWHHIIMSVADGFVLDGTKIGDFTENMADSNTPLQIGGSINFNGRRTEEGYYGMIKIDDTIIIPTENGFKNVTTDQILQILKDGSYTYTENVPIYGEGELYKTINVNVPDLNGSYDEGKTDGVNEQKSKLETINITKNGTYNREDGYNKIIVKVPDLNGSYDEGYEQGQADIAENAIVLNVTENGVYKTKFSDPIMPTTVTGVYADGTEFYNYAELNGKVFNTNIPATMNSRIEFWYKGDNTLSGDAYNVIMGAHYMGDSIVFEVIYNIFSNSEVSGRIGSTYFNTNWDENVWHHIILSVNDGFIVDGVKIGDMQSASYTSNGNFLINANDYNNQRNANGCFGMIKINDTIIIPTADGFKNVNTGELLEVVKDGDYTFTKNLPTYGEGEIYKTINVNVPTAQGQSFDYDITAFTYKVYGWTSANINRDNMTNDCGHRPLDCLLFRNRSGECTVMTKLDNCSGVVRLENGWSGDSIILSLKSNTITKFSSNSINSYQLTSIDTGLAQLEENAIMNCNALTDIKLAILNNNLSVQFASNCFNGLPAEGTITIGKTADVTLTDDEITSFFRTIVGEGWTITIK